MCVCVHVCMHMCVCNISKCLFVIVNVDMCTCVIFRDYVLLLKMLLKCILVTAAWMSESVVSVL